MSNPAINLLPTIFVILGATGDLMQKKLAPSLFRLYEQKELPALFQVVGFSRDSLDDARFRHLVSDMIRAKVKGCSKQKVEEFTRFFSYQQGLFEERAGYENLASRFGMQDGEWKVCSNKLFYLAVPPQFYRTIFYQLAESGLTKPCSPTEGWTRVIVEKPFGKDLQTAQELDRLLGRLFREEQIYRIDHYLGKETVQNILAFRFANSFFEPIWNREAVESIEIKFWEDFGIGDRGIFYDGSGALRDVGQNHILQLLALFLMSNPGDFTPESIRKERARVLKALRVWRSVKDIQQMTMRGQYQGYRLEKDVDASSQTETYFRIETFLQTPRWQGVPIYLEGGKQMPESKVEVTVVFRHSAPCLCPEGGAHYKNTLRYRVQPQEAIHLSFWIKKPGAQMELEEKDFAFDYRAAFEGHDLSDAYKRLLFSVIRGDQTLFVSTEEILAGWKFVDPIVRAWEEGVTELHEYAQKSDMMVKMKLSADV
ncbi:MAG: glucose-6-phosphate dehydrogenase [Candidatus Wildermuthbacteria bacterium RIFCSPHIGHO2_12_FULL_45_9]|uniref:Glucose-6-phosphate 1-dehydrogenase n=1 Tax=Candidatus Wildermuthbacteria bacterium RIFCSPHIGHO2_02_FULL_45_25 TaxID=1802450 RepID=A0A1G2R5G2_9BACT|nr:MAG: glucose-6-phosphate dehydrogenase [Candidatus Wildermuthbacteria bacterium RIFCSPHIGHO2_01_FULL_45_20]OHA67502.1 MAG: glucose-6-phosphate dehydrogenase [Candidatus Wildermuthbacteria bacterium RIFCSPHIGHO2_02_FULL_45_25]OHA72115.1 MAG: glucose-6-phosphate dehydrogenase [Candidatus Wildermuthbacteria bacterium RIFCSPHIGHO2_12_FULL_45_9]